MKKKKKIKNRSKWPEQYRLIYKLPKDYDWNKKYCQSTTDEQALESFHEMFEHLRTRHDKSDDPDKAPVFKKMEKYCRYTDDWNKVEVELE